MPTPTYTPLANITLGSTATTVTFSSISGSYRDLVLVINGTFSSNSSVKIQFNSDGANNYYGVRADGNGSSTGSDSYNASGVSIQRAYFTAGTQSVWTVNIMDYSATDKHKTVLTRPNNAGVLTGMEAHRWANTAAITTMTVQSSVSTFAVGTTMALFGIAS